ncbi:MAG: OmpH family outer membrane protein [Candidatus Hydrogenedentes bacterium]|nr:OmpH family outer membrane protein [Candidatus Hydrogenedentota bacterium]
MKHRVYVTGWVTVAALVASVAGVFVCSEVTSAQEAAAPAGQYKIGVVDRKKAFDGYDRAQKALEDLQADVDARQVDIDKLSEDVLAKKKVYEDNEATMPAEEKEALEEEIEALYRTYREEYKRMQDEIDRQHARLIKKSRDEIDLAVAEIGSEENYHLILEGDPKSGTDVLYYSTTIEITSKVIERLNGSK